MNAAHVGLQLKQIKRLRLLPGGNIKSSNIFFHFAVICIVLALIFLGYLIERAFVAQNAIKIEQIRADLKVMDQEYQSLLINTACLKSPERIEKVAVEKLGMVIPDHINYIQIPSGFADIDGASQESKPPFPFALSDEFWLAKLIDRSDLVFKKTITPGTTAEARINR